VCLAEWNMTFALQFCDCFVFLIQENDRKLLKEIGKNGEGHPEEIQRLVDEVFIVVQSLMLHNSIIYINCV